MSRLFLFLLSICFCVKRCKLNNNEMIISVVQENFRKLTTPNAGKLCNGCPHSLLVEVYNGTAALEDNLMISFFNLTLY